ncbi:MAG: competence/damage-inducible protein A [Firmicutes bacterium]|nr:competence/damage-inducible protein A [Bacillota bacterium]
MKAEIINVGTELLLGDIINSNSNYLSKELAKLGIDVYYHTTVGDNKDRLESVLNNSLKRSELLIFTGGLGPTLDDITKEIIFSTLNKKMILNENILRELKTFFENKKITMTDNNKKQAYIPEGCKVLPNDIGTAPGIYYKDQKHSIVLLPGPPRELKIMFKNHLKPILKKETKHIIKSKTIKLIGIGESSLESIIEDIIFKQDNPTVALYAKEGQVEIRVTAKSESDKKADELINNSINKLKPSIENFVFSYNNESLEEVLIDLLKSKNLKLGVCESCTGGLISSKITSVAGASKVFDRGIITYSNQAKVDELKVSIDTLKKYGAVSKETASEMAKGLLEKTDIDISVSVTGIAGPNGGTKDKPVGLVYIGIASSGIVLTKELNLTGTRKKIQNKTANIVINEVRSFIVKTFDL